MEKVKAKLRRLTKNKDQMVEDTARAREIIKALGGKIKALLDDCGNAIDDIYKAFAKNSKTAKDVEGDDTTKIIDARAGGMDKFKAKDDASKKAWEEERIRLGKTFAEQGAEAEKIAKDIKELNSLGTLSYDATSQGYTELRDIFSANGKFGDGWKKVQIAADWATGAIKESLNKVISLYKVGVKATNAFGNRLIRGDYRDENGDKLEKEDRQAKMNADKNMVKLHREDKDQFNITTKPKDLREYKVVVAEINQAADELHTLDAHVSLEGTWLDDVEKLIDALTENAEALDEPAADTVADTLRNVTVVENNPSSTQTAVNTVANAGKKLANIIENIENSKAGAKAIAVGKAIGNNLRKFGGKIKKKVANSKKRRKRGNESIDSTMFYDDNFFEPAYEMFDDFDDDFDLDMYDYDDFEYSHSDSMFDEDFFD
jgi:DNA-binding ferritin-like protein